MSELTNEVRKAKSRFFNVRFGDKKKGKKAKPEEAMPEQAPEPQPTPAELRAQQKAMKPVSKGFIRLTPKTPKLR